MDQKLQKMKQIKYKDVCPDTLYYIVQEANVIERICQKVELCSNYGGVQDKLRYIVDNQSFSYLNDDKSTGYITYKDPSDKGLFDFVTFDKEDAVEVAGKYLEGKITGHRNSIVNLQKDIVKLHEKWSI
mgnify:CR=1 FL=1